MNIYIDIYRGSKKSDNYYYYRRSDTNNLRYLVYFCTYQNSTKYVLERGGNGRKPWGKSAIFVLKMSFLWVPPSTPLISLGVTVRLRREIYQLGDPRLANIPLPNFSAKFSLPYENSGLRSFLRSGKLRKKKARISHGICTRNNFVIVETLTSTQFSVARHSQQNSAKI